MFDLHLTPNNWKGNTSFQVNSVCRFAGSLCHSLLREANSPSTSSTSSTCCGICHFMRSIVLEEVRSEELERASRNEWIETLLTHRSAFQLLATSNTSLSKSTLNSGTNLDIGRVSQGKMTFVAGVSNSFTTNYIRECTKDKEYQYVLQFVRRQERKDDRMI